MSEETRQALEIIRQEGPNLSLSTIQNIYERGILEYLTQFAVKAQELRQSIRNNGIDQLGLQGLTPDRIDRQSMTLFHKILKHHLPQITQSQIEELIRIIEETAI